jgi:hypothetical protein
MDPWTEIATNLALEGLFGLLVSSSLTDTQLNYGAGFNL